MRSIFLGIGLAAGLAHVACYIAMMSALDRRGIKTNFFLARILVFKYASQYKEATRKETGKTGILYPLCFGSIIVAFLAVLAAVVIRWT